MSMLAVFHPTQFCNLDCAYCWAPERDNKARMSLEVLEASLRQIEKHAPEEIELCWLTGEPLVLGLEYFIEANRLCNSILGKDRIDRKIIQTNATLLNAEWAAFFRENDFRVGVSIDGPERIHNAQRSDRYGRPSFERALAGINLLTEHGVRGGALCVITRRTLELITPDELFFFFHDRGIAWSYLVEAHIGENALSSNALSHADVPRLKHFLARLLDLWGENENSYIRDFDQLVRRLFGSEPDYGFENLGCLDILNILPSGDYYWGNPELITATMGPLSAIRSNINFTNVWDFKKTQEYRSIQRQIYSGIGKCKRECSYFSHCRGGNPAHKYYLTGSFDVSTHLTCEINDKLIAELIISKTSEGLSLPA